MLLTKPSLLQGREYLYFAFTLFSLLLISLTFEYYNYTRLTEFDDAIIEVTVLKHYEKERDAKVYSVLKLRTDEGSNFYITSDAPLKELQGYRAKVWVKTKYLSFLEYLKGFVTKGYVISISQERVPTVAMGKKLEKLHSDQAIAEVYGALFFALPLSVPLQEHFSALGISHLLAISGFHLGVLSFLLIVLLRYPYILLQQHYFPYRNRDRDLFIAIAIILGLYLFFLGEVASLMRAYVMMVVGYFLYDRGLKVISMQTLFVSVLLLLALWPKMLFSLGFWLSVCGVYSIFLYLHYFEKTAWYINILVVPTWVYLMMTPIALVLFGTYSLYHPLSILWSILFTLFYPLALFLHLLGWGMLMDSALEYLLLYPITIEKFDIAKEWLVGYVLLALSARYNTKALLLLYGVAFGVSVATVYKVA